MNAGGQVVEYTEMILFSMIQENPEIVPQYAFDAEDRGTGFFHHRENTEGRWI